MGTSDQWSYGHHTAQREDDKNIRRVLLAIGTGIFGTLVPIQSMHRNSTPGAWQ